MTRGFGIPASREVDRAREIAAGVEDLGYATIWTNDTPSADGLVTAASMADETDSIRIGVGVVAADRRPPEEMVTAIRHLDLPLGRLVLGVGSGSSKHPLGTVRRAVRALRDTLGPEPRIAIAAMGPQMCRLAGEVADTVVLNWMVPERIQWARHRVEEGFARAERDDRPEIVAYVRTAIGPGARQRVAEEANRYNTYPAYTRHFLAMGVPVESVGITVEEGDLSSQLVDYDRVLDELVVRALPASQSVASTLAVAEESAPATKA